ncbi:MAG: hypothetical protein AB2L20_28030 [Mangrovibacterium sp.]
MGVGAGHLKTGSGCRGERIEKFNQIMRIDVSCVKLPALQGERHLRIQEKFRNFIIRCF